MTKKKQNNNQANDIGPTIEETNGSSDKNKSVKKIDEKEKEDDLSSESSSSSSSEDDDDLVLEGVLVRNPDVSSSSSSDEDDDPQQQQDKTNGPSKRKTEDEQSKKKKKKRAGASKPKIAGEEEDDDSSDESSSSDDDDDDLQVEFVFCDMAETYWDGLKSLLFNSSTVYQAHSSGLADLMIENVSVGTIVSTQDNNADGTVFGFCSLLSISNNQESPAMQYLIEYAQRDCPIQYKSQLANILSTSPSSSSSNNNKKKKSSSSGGKEATTTSMTQTGFLLHGRMINLPLEIVHVLYQQVIQDWDWAVENAEGGEEERESYNFQHIIRLAPCTKIPSMAASTAETGKKKKGKNKNQNADSSCSSSCNLIYRYFDDELLATRADLKFVIPAPKSYSKDEELWLEVLVLTRQGFRDAIQQDLQRLAAQET